MTPWIYLSYRPAYAAEEAERLRRDLEALVDEVKFRMGESGASATESRLAKMIRIGSSTHFIALIDPDWRPGTAGTGSTHDVLTNEISMALAAGMAIIPVLIRGATLPPAADLPDAIRELAKLQPLEIRENGWVLALGLLARYRLRERIDTGGPLVVSDVVSEHYSSPTSTPAPATPPATLREPSISERELPPEVRERAEMWARSGLLAAEGLLERRESDVALAVLREIELDEPAIQRKRAELEAEILNPARASRSEMAEREAAEAAARRRDEAQAEAAGRLREEDERVNERIAAMRAEREQRAAELTATAKSFLERGKFDRAIKEARRAAELDPLGSAHAVILEALRRQASLAEAEASEQEAARRAAVVRELLESSAAALRNKDFPRARGLAERALALERDSSAPKELIAKIATAAALSVSALGDETVEIAAAQVDPDATAVIAPASGTWSVGRAKSTSLLSRLTTAFAGVGRWFRSDRQRTESHRTSPSPPTTPVPDTVKCSVFAPPSARPGDAVLIQVFAHLPKDADQASNLAVGFDNRAAERAARFLSQPVGRGTALTFSLSIPGIPVDEPLQSLLWGGEPDSVQFGVNIPLDQREGRLIPTIIVSQESVPFGHLKFILDIVPAAAATHPERTSSPEQTWKRYEYAFISYASQDRVEVLKRVQMLERTGIDFFQDLLSLDPGERWERTLYRIIDESDVFFLFWSTAAKNSEWVMKEVRYAIERHGGDYLAPPEIVPVLIEGPPPVPPPPELKNLHFNDKFLYFIAGST